MNHPLEDSGFVVGIDIGGTKVEGSLFDRSGRIQATERCPSPRQNSVMLDLIGDMVGRLAGQSVILGVGFSIPGSLDRASGLLRNAPNSPAIEGSPLRRDLQSRLPYELVFENDANCLVLSEHRFGIARGCRHLVGIILGTGVGAGVMLDGRLLHGSGGLAPEPGHLPLDVLGRTCRCGNKGCVEAYLSGPAILARYHEAGGDTGVEDSQTLFQRTDDQVAKAILEETRYFFARFIAALVSLYDPELFVLGGGLAQQPLFRQAAGLASRYLFGSRRAPSLKLAAAGDASGKLGAAILVFDAAGVAPKSVT